MTAWRQEFHQRPSAQALQVIDSSENNLECGVVFRLSVHVRGSVYTRVDAFVHMCARQCGVFK